MILKHIFFINKRVKKHWLRNKEISFKLIDKLLLVSFVC